MAKIMISYRRDDSGVITGRIFDRFVAHYGVESVFRDIDNIPPGADFRDHINTVLNTSEIVIAVVGPKWIGPRSGQNRLLNPADPVRVEIEAVLHRKVPLIPILVLRAKMPRIDQLPPSLEDFAYRHAVQVDAGQDFDVHMARLIRSIDRVLQENTEQPVVSAEIAMTSVSTGDDLRLPAAFPSLTRPAGKAQEQRAAEARRKVEAEAQAAGARRKAEEEERAAEARRKTEEEQRAAEARKTEEEQRAAGARRKAEEEERTATRRKVEEEQRTTEARRHAEQEDRIAETRGSVGGERLVTGSHRKAAIVSICVIVPLTLLLTALLTAPLYMAGPSSPSSTTTSSGGPLTPTNQGLPQLPSAMVTTPNVDNEGDYIHCYFPTKEEYTKERSCIDSGGRLTPLHP
jgi:TIR domain